MSPILIKNANNIEKYMLIEQILYYISTSSNNVIIEFPNTSFFNQAFLKELKKINPSRIFVRVAGGNDQELIDFYNQMNWNSDFLTNDVIYSIDEMISIMRVIENIEKGMDSKWDDFQKIVYFINCINSRIMYHPFNEHAESRDIRSLRGLVSGNTVCAGFALILKEFCDRNNIECDFVVGDLFGRNADGKKERMGCHAWNIVRINGKNIPIDITPGIYPSVNLDGIGNVQGFVEARVPYYYNKVKEYDKNLSNIERNYLKELYELMSRNNTYSATAYSKMREDKSYFNIVQTDQFKIGSISVYTYIYTPSDVNGKLGKPQIFYSCLNVAWVNGMFYELNRCISLLDEARQRNDVNEINSLTQKVESLKIAVDYNSGVINKLFSKENIEAAISDKSYFLGDITFQPGIQGCNIFKHPLIHQRMNKMCKNFDRSDGTSFSVEAKDMVEVNGKKIFQYKIYEFVDEDGDYVVRKNTIFTEANIITDNRKEVADLLLSRSRINYCEKDNGGYVGYLTNDNSISLNLDVNQYFKRGIYEKTKMKDHHIKKWYPELTYDNLVRLAQTYMVAVNNGRVEVYRRNGGAYVSDEVISVQAQFAIAWFNAFNINPNQSNERYRDFFLKISKCLEAAIYRIGYIDTFDIVYLANNIFNEDQEVINAMINLFSNDYNVRLVNHLYSEQCSANLLEDAPLEILNDREAVLQRLEEKKREQQAHFSKAA